MKEIWKKIDGYDCYFVSNLGRVLSKSRLVRCKGGYRRIGDKFLKATDNGNGYKIVGLNDAERKNHYIHRLVACAFLDNPNGLAEVNHKDFNKSNNRVDNLEWVSRLDNVRHAVPHRTGIKFYERKGELHHICIRIGNGKPYRVTFKRREKTFSNLNDAIEYRDNVIGESLNEINNAG